MKDQKIPNPFRAHRGIGSVPMAPQIPQMPTAPAQAATLNIPQPHAPMTPAVHQHFANLKKMLINK